MNKEEVGELVVNICGICFLEFYKGKGICYVGEYVCCKEGKIGK